MVDSLFDLGGRTALITGSSEGLGLAMGRGLARSGARVILNGRDEAKLDDALRVLLPQREAWEGVCKELGTTTPLENEAAAASLSDHDTPPKPHAGLDPSADSDRPGEAPAGFSLEA